MNRIIKFRVWDDKYRFFLNNYSASLVMGVALAYGHNGCDTEELGTWIDFSDIDNKEKYSHYHIQQFTGLKDKNNKEIYEGDILSFNQSHISQFKGKLIYLIKYLEDISAFCLFSDCGDWHYITKEYLMTGEIIGNIYENPELIK